MNQDFDKNLTNTENLSENSDTSVVGEVLIEWEGEKMLKQRTRTDANCQTHKLGNSF